MLKVLKVVQEWNSMRSSAGSTEDQDALIENSVGTYGSAMRQFIQSVSIIYIYIIKYMSLSEIPSFTDASACSILMKVIAIIIGY